MLTWLDGRNESSFGSMNWNGNALSFTVTAAVGAHKLQGMVPVNASGSLELTGITYNGSPVSYTTEVIKGINYAFFDANGGNYVANYGPGGTGLSNRLSDLRQTDVTVSDNKPLYYLGQNYPNPGRSLTTITYIVSEKYKCRIVVV